MNNDDYFNVQWDDYPRDPFSTNIDNNNPILTYGNSNDYESTANSTNQPESSTSGGLDINNNDDHSILSNNNYHHEQNGQQYNIPYDSVNYDTDNNNNKYENQDSKDHNHHRQLHNDIDNDNDNGYDNHNMIIPKQMIIQVEEPQKSEGSYISYLITTYTQVETFSSNHPKPVRRRFQDFVWLYNALSLEYPACVIPFLPEKYRLKYIKGDRFDNEFIEKRRLGLQLFLNRIARHPFLQLSQSTRIFLESRDFKNDKNMQSKRIPRPSSMFTSLNGTLFKSFSKVKKPDDRFIMIKETVDKYEDNLNIIERLYSRIGRRQLDLVQDYLDFAGSLRGLSVLEISVERKLRQFAETTESFAGNITSLAQNEDKYYLNNIHELLSYCRATKEQLQERDKKQVDFEELTTYLQRLSEDRERLLHPGQYNGNALNISEFMADKMGELKGNKLTQTRSERLSRIQYKLEELQEEVLRANDANNTFSNQMLKEYEIFQSTRKMEMKQCLTSYADSHIDFCQKGIDLWSSIIPVLESMDLNTKTDID
ncbi:unnamed protein product [Cunninghamella echinulata]